MVPAIHACLRQNQFVCVAAVGIAPTFAAVLSLHGSMVGLTDYYRDSAFSRSL
jgi:hypothetical protein